MKKKVKKKRNDVLEGNWKERDIVVKVGHVSSFKKLEVIFTNKSIIWILLTK